MAQTDDLPELIDSALDGNQSAYEAIYQKLVGQVYRLAYGVLLNGQDAEEVVQDSFTYAFKNLHRFDPSLSAFKTWLYTITMSRCRNKRRRKILPTVDISKIADFLPGNETTPEASAVRQDGRDMVVEALKQLSPKLREAVVLRYFDGLAYREMAEVLGCPQKTAESRVRLAHNALYEILEDQRELLGGLFGYDTAR